MNFPSLTKYRTAAIVGLALVASHGAAFGAGHLISSRQSAEAQAQVNKDEGVEAVAAVVAEAEAAQITRTERVVRDLARERELAAELAAATNRYNELRRAFDAKYDPDPDVRLRAGDVRLLDDVAAGIDTAAAGVSDPAVLAAYEEQTPSDVSLRSFVGTELDIRQQYNDLARNHDALVDWVEDELIAPQTRSTITSDLNTTR